MSRVGHSSVLIDHIMSPRNAGAMESPDATGKASPNGGAPYFEIYLKVKGRTVEKAMFTVFGCGYSIASCSALTELITGRSVEECLSISAGQIVEALGGMPAEKRYCAQLAVEAMRDALSKVGEGTAAGDRR